MTMTPTLLRRHPLKRLLPIGRSGLAGVLLAGWAALMPCESLAVQPISQTDLLVQAKAARDELTAAIGDAACRDTSDCRTTPVGHKACGGPEAWLAWSAWHGDPSRIAALSARDSEVRRAVVEASGRMSTCSVATNPGASCDNGRCVMNDREPAQPAPPQQPASAPPQATSAPTR